jgi:[ribosomal protein S5]-alanine N-acetyltransferase
MLTIETSHLIMRDLQETDLQPFFALSSDPAITQFQTFIQVENEAQAAEWLKNAARHNLKQPREAYNMAVIRKQEQQWIGWIGMGSPRDTSLGDLDFGYALSRQYWGMGYMTEALRGMVDFSFRELGIQSMFGACEVENVASARVMEKAGFRLSATYEEADEVTGRMKKMLRYAIARPEWEKEYQEELIHFSILP